MEAQETNEPSWLEKEARALAGAVADAWGIDFAGENVDAEAMSVILSALVRARRHGAEVERKACVAWVRSALARSNSDGRREEAKRPSDDV